MNERKIGISSTTLHILAMIFMLCDHLWATIIPGNTWLTCIGRLAYPIFAFMIVEGYFHTRNLRKYVVRLLIFALISEIPFNLMYGSNIIYPYHQNVLWTFLIGILMIYINELVREKRKPWLCVLTFIGTVAVGALLGIVTMTDYNGVGVVIILVFYLFRHRKWWCLMGQIVCLYYLNVEVLKGLYFEIDILGETFNIVQQGLALLALIPIWIYNGRQGTRSKFFQYFCYIFYPAHMLILALIMQYLSVR